MFNPCFKEYTNRMRCSCNKHSYNPHRVRSKAPMYVHARPLPHAKLPHATSTDHMPVQRKEFLRSNLHSSFGIYQSRESFILVPRVHITVLTSHHASYMSVSQCTAPKSINHIHVDRSLFYLR